jgi:hypothetical protein
MTRLSSAQQQRTGADAQAGCEMVRAAPWIGDDPTVR